MILNLLHSFARNDKGATAVEYSVIAAGIALVLVPIMGEVGSGVLSMWGDIGDAFAR